MVSRKTLIVSLRRAILARRIEKSTGGCSGSRQMSHLESLALRFNDGGRGMRFDFVVDS